LIIGKIHKIIATRYQILRLKCTKFVFRWGSAPDHTGELKLSAAFKGPTCTSMGRGGEEWGEKGDGPQKALIQPCT